MTALLGDLLAVTRRIDLNAVLGEAGLTNPSVLMSADGRDLHLVFKKNQYDRRAVWQTGDRQWDAILDRDGRFRVEHVHARLTPELDLRDRQSLAMPPLRLGAQGFDAADDLRLIDWNGRLHLLGSCLAVRRRPEGGTWKVSGMAMRMFLAPFDPVFLAPFDPVAAGAAATGGAVVLPAFFNATDTDKNWVTHERSSGPLLLGIDLNRTLWLALERLPQGPFAMPRHDLAWQGGWSGSSSLVKTRGGYLAVLHRAVQQYPSVYRHMFVLCDERFRVLRRSLPFTFEGQPVEFCIGLTRHADRRHVILTYGVWDDESRLLAMPEDQVVGLCTHVLADPRELYSVL